MNNQQPYKINIDNYEQNSARYGHLKVNLQSRLQVFLSCNLNRFKGICFGNVILYLFLLSLVVFGLNSCDNERIISNQKESLKSEVVWSVDINAEIDKFIVLTKDFDKHGNLVKITNFNNDGDKTEESSFIYYGQKSQEIKIKYDDFGGEISKEKINYSYDQNGRIIQKEIKKTNDTSNSIQQNFEYDRLGNVIKIIETNKNKVTEKLIDYSFNNNGQVSEIVYNPEFNQDERKDSLVYNSKQNSIKMYSIDQNGQIESSTLFRYNNVGRILFTEFFDKNNKLTKKYRHQYLFY